MLSGSDIKTSAARQMTSGTTISSAAGSAEGRPPAVLQVIPSLVSGGAERGTVEMAAALVAAGWTAYVASSGGPMERQLARVGAHHIDLPLASKNPLIMRRNAARAERHHPAAPDRHRARAQPRPGLERVVGRARDAPPLCDDVPQRLRHRPAAEALVQFGHGARRAGHRDLAIRRRARRERSTASARTGCGSSRAASISRRSIRIGCGATGSRRWRGNGGCRTTSRS